MWEIYPCTKYESWLWSWNCCIIKYLRGCEVNHMLSGLSHMCFRRGTGKMSHPSSSQGGKIKGQRGTRVRQQSIHPNSLQAKVWSYRTKKGRSNVRLTGPQKLKHLGNATNHRETKNLCMARKSEASFANCKPAKWEGNWLWIHACNIIQKLCTEWMTQSVQLMP